MNLSQKTLLGLLEDIELKTDKQTFYSLNEKDKGYLTPIDMANLYVTSALLVTIMTFLKEELWLKKKEDNINNEMTSYEAFIVPFFSNELISILFLKDFLVNNGSENIKKITVDSQVIERKVLSLINKRSNIDRKAFLTKSLNIMKLLFLHEEKEQEGRDQNLGHQGPRLYRTFDNLDDIFNFNYSLDSNMKVDQSIKERLYEGAGVGVQSGYSTILLSLEEVKTRKGAKVIDLGSGYGRVGLVYSLLRPDIDFTGYEYVPHRVELGNNACELLTLKGSLNFIVQDLSLESFKIPDADVYYLYDPFTKETYHYVLKQLVELSKIKQITIVTKGNAREWLKEISVSNSWPLPRYIDESNLCIFKTSEIS